MNYLATHPELTSNPAVQWVFSNGYLLLFVAILIEGPAVTSAGAFAARLGYLNIWLVFLLSILGNLIPDVAYYAMGYWGREKLAARWGHYVGLTRERLERIEEFLKIHPGKTLFVIKIIPTLATPGLIAVGIARMSIRPYIWWSMVITVPTSALFLGIGWYFGAAYQSIIRYVDYGGYLLAGFIALFLLFSYVYHRLGGRLGRRIKEF